MQEATWSLKLRTSSESQKWAAKRTAATLISCFVYSPWLFLRPGNYKDIRRRARVNEDAKGPRKGSRGGREYKYMCVCVVYMEAQLRNLRDNWRRPARDISDSVVMRNILCRRLANAVIWNVYKWNDMRIRRCVIYKCLQKSISRVLLMISRSNTGLTSGKKWDIIFAWIW